jgi:hypothetical protein
MVSLQLIPREMHPFIKEGGINIFPGQDHHKNTKIRCKRKVNYLYKPSFYHTKEKERKAEPMELSREFTKKFSEIFLEGTMADVFNRK